MRFLSNRSCFACYLVLGIGIRYRCQNDQRDYGCNDTRNDRDEDGMIHSYIGAKNNPVIILFRRSDR